MASTILAFVSFLFMNIVHTNYAMRYCCRNAASAENFREEVIQCFSNKLMHCEVPKEKIEDALNEISPENCETYDGIKGIMEMCFENKKQKLLNATHSCCLKVSGIPKEEKSREYSNCIRSNMRRRENRFEGSNSTEGEGGFRRRHRHQGGDWGPPRQHHRHEGGNWDSRRQRPDQEGNRRQFRREKWQEKFKEIKELVYNDDCDAAVNKLNEVIEEMAKEMKHRNNRGEGEPETES